MPPVAGSPAIELSAAGPPVTPIERRQFDYSDLEAAMALADQTIRQTRRNLDALLSNQT